MKTCFKCSTEQPLTEFYKHKAMGDGHLGKCKTCTKSDVMIHRNNNIEKIRAYDRARGNRHRPGYIQEYNEKYPAKYKAKNMVNNAVRDGRLSKEPCSECGTTERIHAHHDDYAKPLNVRWLCAAHHHQWHAKNGQALNPF